MSVRGHETLAEIICCNGPCQCPEHCLKDSERPVTPIIAAKKVVEHLCQRWKAESINSNRPSKA